MQTPKTKRQTRRPYNPKHQRLRSQSDLRLHYRATILGAEWCGHRNRHISQWHRLGRNSCKSTQRLPPTLSHMCQQRTLDNPETLDPKTLKLLREPAKAMVWPQKLSEQDARYTGNDLGNWQMGLYEWRVFHSTKERITRVRGWSMNGTKSSSITQLTENESLDSIELQNWSANPLRYNL